MAHRPALPCLRLHAQLDRLDGTGFHRSIPFQPAVLSAVRGVLDFLYVALAATPASNGERHSRNTFGTAPVAAVVDVAGGGRAAGVELVLPLLVAAEVVAMNDRRAACPSCQQSLPGLLCNTAAPTPCPACGHQIQVAIFPAFFQAQAVGQTGERIVEEGVSSCFYHEQKKAVAHCDGCGRFLCALCDLEMNGRHFCPTCLDTGRKKGRLPELDNRRTLYDGAALTLALLPLLIWPFTLLTAPAAIGCAVLSFKRPGSIVRRSPWRSYLAIAVAVVQIIGWGVGAYFIVRGN